jgi:hypothetical protein
VTFAPDGNTLASAGEDKTIRLWDVRAKQLLKTLHGHENSALSVAFAPDGKTLASGSEDGTVRLWDPATGKGQGTLQGRGGKIWGLAFAPDGRTLVASRDNGAEAWLEWWDGVAQREQAALRYKEGGAVLSMAFSRDGRFLATAHYSSGVKVWDATTRQELDTLSHPDHVLAVAFTPDGKTLASTSEDKTIRLWDMATRRERFTLRGHQHAVSSLAFAPDGLLLVTGDHGGIVRLWDAPRDESPEPAARTGGPSPKQVRDWHRREAAACEEDGQWFGARWHLDRLIGASPSSWQLRARRARACLGVGHRAAYRRDCAALLDHLGGTDQPALGEVAGTCLLGPEAVADYTGLIRALERAVAADPGACTYRHLLGGILYRAGQWQAAVGQLNEISQTRKHTKDGGSVDDWLFLAMAHQRLGHADEAQKWLDKAVKRIGPAAVQPLAWQLLRREAETLLSEARR